MIVFSLLFEQLQLSDRFTQQETAHSRIYKAGLELNMGECISRLNPKCKDFFAG
jgi:hypothetical protein